MMSILGLILFLLIAGPVAWDTFTNRDYRTDCGYPEPPGRNPDSEPVQLDFFKDVPLEQSGGQP